MKFAYIGSPHAGGTWTVFLMLRAGLARHSIELEWLKSGLDGGRVARDDLWREYSKSGVIVAEDSEDGLGRVKSILHYLDKGGFSGVFINVFADPVEMSAAKYIPASIHKVMIVHNITPATYAAARALRNYVHAVVGVSPRIGDDLIGRFGFPSDWTLSIPNGVELTDYEGIERGSVTAGPLRALFLGRIKDQDKGVFWLRPIMEKLAPNDVSLTIAGDGPDLAALKIRMAPFADRVNFLGRVPYAEVPSLLARHDVLIFPSRFEGLPLTLVEAMAAGCVPVASRIRGVTDHVIKAGETGLLFSIGDTAAAARSIVSLANDRDRLAAMSRAARADVQGNFGVADMADAYAKLISRLSSSPRPISDALPLTHWSMPNGLRPGLRSYLPTPLKNILREIRERVA